MACNCDAIVDALATLDGHLTGSLDDIRSDMESIKADLLLLKTDVSLSKIDIRGINENTNGLKSGISDIFAKINPVDFIAMSAGIFSFGDLIKNLKFPDLTQIGKTVEDSHVKTWGKVRPDINAEWAKSVGTYKDAVEANSKTLYDRIGNIDKNVKDGFGTVGDLKDAVQDQKGWLNEIRNKADDIKDKAGKIGDQVGEVATKADDIKGKVKDAADKAGDAANKAGELFGKFNLLLNVANLIFSMVAYVKAEMNFKVLDQKLDRNIQETIVQAGNVNRATTDKVNEVKAEIKAGNGEVIQKTGSLISTGILEIRNSTGAKIDSLKPSIEEAKQASSISAESSKKAELATGKLEISIGSLSEDVKASSEVSKQSLEESRETRKAVGFLDQKAEEIRKGLGGISGTLNEIRNNFGKALNEIINALKLIEIQPLRREIEGTRITIVEKMEGSENAIKETQIQESTKIKEEIKKDKKTSAISFPESSNSSLLESFKQSLSNLGDRLTSQFSRLEENAKSSLRENPQATAMAVSALVIPAISLATSKLPEILNNINTAANAAKSCCSSTKAMIQGESGINRDLIGKIYINTISALRFLGSVEATGIANALGIGSVLYNLGQAAIQMENLQRWTSESRMLEAINLATNLHTASALDTDLSGILTVYDAVDSHLSPLMRDVRGEQLLKPSGLVPLASSITRPGISVYSGVNELLTPLSAVVNGVPISGRGLTATMKGMEELGKMEALLAQVDDYEIRIPAKRPVIVIIYKEKIGLKWGRSTYQSSIFHPSLTAINTLFLPSFKIPVKKMGSHCTSIGLIDGSKIVAWADTEASSLALFNFLYGNVDATKKDLILQPIHEIDKSVGKAGKILHPRQVQYFPHGTGRNAKALKTRKID